MATLIKNARIENDHWRLLSAGVERLLCPAEDGLLPDLPAYPDLMVPLVLWQRRREDLLERPGRLGVWLDSNEEPGAIADHLDRFVLVAVNFPKFGDGRGYSIARLLRERYGYKGELRAIGEVVRDHLFFMAQCGFDAFALREDQDPQEALAAFGDFSENYQASVTQPSPLFRRRSAAQAA
jgi:uncharacterized protein (DUF934 family)